MSPYHAKDMTWHHFHTSDNGVMVHPSDGEAWKEFNRVHLSFASDPRNVRLGLCTDGFCPFDMSSNTYSCWPVIVTVYNLPPWKCMTRPFMFLTMMIPGPKNPGKKLDIFLRPLIDELKNLCQSDKFLKGVIERLPPLPRPSGLEMLNEVSKYTEGHNGSSSCNDKIPGFGVKHNWVKKSIFWELPYWHTNLIRHNLDVMHIEKNVFDNIFYTVMDCPNRSKDNLKARLDIQLYCKKPNLHLQQDMSGRVYKPKGTYCLHKKQQQEVLSWMKELSFPDGYASNISRCVKEAQCKILKIKSHDCHVFIQRLLPTAFRPYLPRPLWEALTELSVFFRDICTTNLNAQHMELMQMNIIEIMCKLERIFPPSFFDSMEHLMIHLPYEAKVGGPKKVTNKAKVEGSICEAYLIDEITNFASHYFGDDVQTIWNRVPRNDDGGLNISSKNMAEEDNQSLHNENNENNRARTLRDHMNPTRTNRQMVELMCNGTFEDKDPDEAMEYLDLLAENAQNWDTTGTYEAPSKTQPHTSSGGMYNLREDHDLQAKFASLARKVEALELKKSECLHEQAHALNSFQRPNHNPYSQTYNPGWRNHPNFSWKSENNNAQTSQPQFQAHHNFQNSHGYAPPYAPPPTRNFEETLYAFIEKQETINTQLAQSITDFKDTLAKFTSALNFQEQGKFPSKPQQNLKEQYNANASSSRSQHMDQVKSVTTLRSGKVIEKPSLEPYEKDDESISKGKEGVESENCKETTDSPPALPFSHAMTNQE
ncbi:PREDICTED: uncharacterized protein LOC105111246, partial [Populus euphratica]|uniref:Uncharacterized protein LOC105111246 n=1 Tax=Populus euphratica TaxID=75702 RepID=A0AAJ6X498_POPEU